MKQQESYRKEWNASFARGDNNILYPQTEVVRFLNRHIAKRVSLSEVRSILGQEKSATKDVNQEIRPIRCLDFACGAGVHAITCEDFNIECYGVDISEVAIEKAKSNAKHLGFHQLVNRLSVIENDKQLLPFEDNFFDAVIAESCLDSMPLHIAKRYVHELKRVTKGKIFVSLISSAGVDGFVGDAVVEAQHEKDTIQHYFDVSGVCELLACNLEAFVEIKEVLTNDVATGQAVEGRYYCVLLAE